MMQPVNSLSPLQFGAEPFRTLFEKSGEVTLLIDADSGDILDCNEAAVEFYGYTAQKLKSLHIWDINTLPREIILHRLHQVTLGSRVHFEFQHRLSNGAIRDVDVYTVALDSAGRKIIYSTIHDQTASKTAQAGAILFRRVVAASMNGIIITDATPDTRIMYVNPAFEHLTGYTLAEVREKNPRFLQGAQKEQSGRDEIRIAIKEGRAVQAILKNYRKDGTAYWCEVSISPVRDKSGTVVSWMGMQTDITARREAEKKLEYLAFFDALTGIPNRQLVLDRLDRHLLQARRTGEHGALLFLDLDQFKQVNEVQGHEAGNELLRTIARNLQGLLRESDTVGRLTGDEFVLLLPNVATTAERTVEQLQKVLQRLDHLFSTPIKINNFEYSITASIGITIFPQENVTAADLVTQADIAMHRAKESGRNTTCYFEPLMQEHIKETMVLVHDLHEALARSDFRVFLQPQVDQSGKLLGAEALIRWQHREGGLISPAKFIPVAEDTGLIVPMGEFMLREACWMLRKLQAAGAAFRLSVNVSLRQFQLATFPERVKQIITTSEINPTYLTLEITESVLLHDAKAATAKMREISQMGIGFSIDDFGTGYSSLGYLKNLPLKELKIDRSFIQDVPGNSNDTALVEAILAIAHHHDLRVVAEGIETAGQFEFLKSRGCPLFQGYLFGRPVPAAELVDTMLAQCGGGNTGVVDETGTNR
ncbi:MAG: sensor domain-containing protein [Phycisphaerae bacterium]